MHKSTSRTASTRDFIQIRRNKNQKWWKSVVLIISSTRAFVQIRCNLHHSSSTQWWKSIKCFIYITCIKQQSNWFENKYICLKTNRTISIIFLLLMNNFVLHLCFLVLYPPLSPLFVGDFVSFFSNWRFWWRWWGPAEPGPSAQPKSPTLTQNKNAEKIIFIFLAMIVKNWPWCWCCRPFQALVRNLFIWKKCGGCDSWMFLKHILWFPNCPTVSSSSSLLSSSLSSLSSWEKKLTRHPVRMASPLNALTASLNPTECQKYIFYTGSTTMMPPEDTAWFSVNLFITVNLRVLNAWWDQTISWCEELGTCFFQKS